MDKSEKSIKGVSKDLDDNQILVDELSKEIIGYGDTISRIIDNDVTKVNFDRFSVTRAKTIQNNLFTIKGKDAYSKYQISERLYAALTNPSIDPRMISGVLEGRFALNMEMNYILNEMIELQSAVDMLADDVVFPNASATTGIKIEFIGNDEANPSERNDELIKFFRPLENPINTLRYKKKYNYNIEEDVKGIIRSFAVYGHQIVATIPYKKIAADLLLEHEARKGMNTPTTGAEAYDFMMKELHKRVKPYKESVTLEKLDTPESHTISDNMKHIVSLVPYSESSVEYVSFLMENEDLWEKGKPNKVNTDIGTLLGKGEDEVNSYKTIENIKKANSRKFNVDGLIGCTHDILDPNRTIPVYIKDELLGVYVVDSGFMQPTKLGGNLANLTGTSTLTDDLSSLNSSSDYSAKLKTIILQDIKKILDTNLDKRFIKNNPTLLEDIEFILSREDNIGTLASSKVRFIPIEYLTIHKIGPGPLGIPLLLKARSYAHMHINLLKSDMLSKMFLEKPRYKVKIPFNGDVSNLARIKQSVDSFKYALPRLSDVAIPDVINTSSANYHTIIMPYNNQGNEMYEIEPLPPIEGKDNMEYLRYLRNQATMILGYPADIFDPSSQIDFAKKIANINLNTLVKVISLQNALSLSMSEYCSKRIKYMTGNENIDVIIKFEIPGDITSNISKEVFEQKNALSDIMFEYIDKSPKVEDRHKEQVKQYINKKLLEGVMDMDLIEEAIEKVSTYQAGTKDIDE